VRPRRERREAVGEVTAKLREELDRSVVERVRRRRVDRERAERAPHARERCRRRRRAVRRDRRGLPRGAPFARDEVTDDARLPGPDGRAGGTAAVRVVAPGDRAVGEEHPGVTGLGRRPDRLARVVLGEAHPGLPVRPEPDEDPADVAHEVGRARAPDDGLMALGEHAQAAVDAPLRGLRRVPRGHLRAQRRVGGAELAGARRDARLELLEVSADLRLDPLAAPDLTPQQHDDATQERGREQHGGRISVVNRHRGRQRRQRQSASDHGRSLAVTLHRGRPALGAETVSTRTQRAPALSRRRPSRGREDSTPILGCRRRRRQGNHRRWRTIGGREAYCTPDAVPVSYRPLLTLVSR
jgi:hypothetical protein